MASRVDRLIERLGGWILPPHCVLCSGAGQRPCLDLCADCAAELPVLAPGCPRCGVGSPLVDDPIADTMAGVCGRCTVAPPPFDRCHAAFDYAPPVDSLIQGLKYRGHLSIGRVLGELLARSVAGRALHTGPDVIVPTPLHPLRHAARGFNQAAEIARWTARRLGLRFDDGLVARRVDRPPQVGSSPAQRRANLVGAFDATPAGVAGRRIAVVDDVFTTGSTASEMALALRRAGATDIQVWCVAMARPRRSIQPTPPQRNR